MVLRLGPREGRSKQGAGRAANVEQVMLSQQLLPPSPELKVLLLLQEGGGRQVGTAGRGARSEVWIPGWSPPGDVTLVMCRALT